jgi:hypothetical protein
MRLLSLLVALAIPLVLAGCASTAVGPVREGSHTLLPGQSVEVARNARLTYESAADSRCPPDVHCIWAGELVYHFVLTGPGPAESFSLGLTKEGTYFSTALSGARIVLAHAVVPPVPAAGATPPSYPVTLNVSRQ